MVAANIMTPGAITLTRNKTMLDAIRLISDKKIRQIPVVDAENKVIGVITPRRLMRAILPPYISEGMVADVKFAPELPEFIEKIDELRSKNVDDVLEKEYTSVGPDTHTMEIAALFVNSRRPVESILVLDGQKRLLGIISPWDIFKRLWEYAEKKN